MTPHARVAYILLWFPKPTETFVFGEVCRLRELGLPVEVFTLYGRWRKKLSDQMATYPGPVTRLGVAGIGRLARDLTYWLVHRPGRSLAVLGLWFRRWRGLETAAEALWALLGSFSLARWCRARGIGHLHADWADGPATAAWAASRLTGLPFSFTGRAHDIHPPDGALAPKIAAAAWVRADVAGVADYLGQLAPKQRAKIHLVRACQTLPPVPGAPLRFAPPYRLLAVGRLVDKKGFDLLLAACAELAGRGLEFRLTLAGDGPRRRRLQRLAQSLGLGDKVTFPGFVPHHRIPDLYQAADLMVAPSRITAAGDRDGIPNVLVEAMSHRLPVVACDVAGIGEVVIPGRTGWLAPPDDAGALTRAMEQALSDRDRALTYARQGRDLVNRMFDPAARAADLLRLFTQGDAHWPSPSTSRTVANNCSR